VDALEAQISSFSTVSIVAGCEAVTGCRGEGALCLRRFVGLL